MDTTTGQPRWLIRLAHGVVLGLLALPVAATAAHAIPEIAYPSSGTTTPERSDRLDVSRPCFLVRGHWNAALDGPQPRC